MSDRSEHPLTKEERANIVTARETIRLALKETISADLPSAARYLDQVLESTCPHDPETWVQEPHETGDTLVTCLNCGVSWYR